MSAAEGADLLIHDATFANDASERAAETGHSTAGEAAEVANRAGAKALALTHISSRYAGDAREISEGASGFAGEAFVAHDGLKYEIPYPDDE